MNTTLVLYHDNCRDGFGAALAAWCRFGDTADYQSVQYGRPAPEVAGRDTVYILDFSFPRDELLRMAKRVGSVFVIDHHASAERALAGLEGEAENLYCTFDMQHSGAVLAWQHFFGDDVPVLLQYIEDRDLWRHALPRSEQVALGLGCLPQTFQSWHEVIGAGNDGIRKLADAGAAVRQYLDLQIVRLTRNPPRMRLFGHDVPVLNVPGFLASDVGNVLSQGEPFAATYFLTATQMVVSLRSAPEGLDVSRLAESVGGGGHAHAAGFTLGLVPGALPLYDGFGAYSVELPA